MIAIGGTLCLKWKINVVCSHHILNEGDLLHCLGHHALHLLHVCRRWGLTLYNIVTKLHFIALSLNLFLFLFEWHWILSQKWSGCRFAESEYRILRWDLLKARTEYLITTNGRESIFRNLQCAKRVLLLEKTYCSIVYSGWCNFVMYFLLDKWIGPIDLDLRIAEHFLLVGQICCALEEW